MYPPDVFRSTLVRLLEVLQRLDVRCHLTGGITSVAYGEPRMTQDIDLVVDNAASKLVWASFGSHKSRRDLRRMVVGMSEAEHVEFGRLAGALGHASLLGEILGEPDEISG